MICNRVLKIALFRLLGHAVRKCLDDALVNRCGNTRDDRAPDHAPASQGGAGDDFLVERKTGQKAGVAGKDLGRHDHIAGLQRRIEPAGDAERDDAPECR